jgi:hypothetical protein
VDVALARGPLKPDQAVPAGNVSRRGRMGSKRSRPPTTSIEELKMTAAAVPLAIAGTGYGLIGLLVIIVLVLVIWRLI